VKGMGGGQWDGKWEVGTKYNRSWNLSWEDKVGSGKCSEDVKL
jgi:hypothetical protein